MLPAVSSRDHKLEPWVSDNGLRVEKRSYDGFWLTWDTEQDEEHPPSNPPSATTSGEDASVDWIGATDGLDGPWYEVQSRVGMTEDWQNVYRGYRKRIQVKNLLPDTTYYFRMKKNGERDWGSEIIAATDALPPYADDIHRAVACDATDMVLRIIASTTGPQLRRMLVSVDSLGMTPLMIACQQGNFGMVNVLVQAGAWPSATSFSSRKTAAMYAAIGGNTQIMELLDQAGVDWIRRDNTGCNALHHAVTADKVSSVRFLLNLLGMQYLEDKDGFGWSLLLRAIVCGSSLPLIQFLLEQGANPDAVDKLQMKSCLIAATINCRSDQVRALLDFGADPSYRNTLDKTALCIAKKVNLREITEMILEKQMKSAMKPNSSSHPCHFIQTGAASSVLPQSGAFNESASTSAGAASATYHAPRGTPSSLRAAAEVARAGRSGRIALRPLNNNSVYELPKRRNPNNN